MTESASAELRSFALTDYPGINRFAVDVVQRREPAAELANPPWPTERGESALRGDLAAALSASNAEWGNDIAHLLKPWVAGESEAVIAGQQVGFAGGPLYTLAKIATLLKLARARGNESKPQTIFFWLASEDHDYAEVSSLTLQRRGKLVTLRASGKPSGRSPVGALTLPVSLRKSFLAETGLSAPPWLEEGLTFTESFARLIVEVVGSGSIVLVDSLLPELRRAGAPILQRIAAEHARLEEGVRSCSRTLEAAGYSPQVLPRDDGHFPFLFLIDERGERVPLACDPAGKWFDSDRRLSDDQIRDVIDHDPVRLSTGALGRPLLQDYLFAPSHFVGGPAEVSYYAQLSGAHAALNLHRPWVALRGHGLVAPERELRAVERYGLALPELARNADEILVARESSAMAELDRRLRDAEGGFATGLEGLREFVVSRDPSLARTFARSARSIEYQMARLRVKGQRAIARHDRERYDAVARLAATLFPGGVPQDRIVGWIGYWLQYGDALLEKLVDALAADSNDVRIVSL